MDSELKDAGQIWQVVVNMHAGNGKTEELWKETADLLTIKHISYTCKFAGIDSSATDITYRSAAAGYRKFLAVGGDGTIHDVLNGIMNFVNTTSENIKISDFSIAVIPNGSGNDWIRSHNIGFNTGETIDLLASGSFIKQDIVKVTIPGKISYMINIGGVGFDARVCERANIYKAAGKRGKSLYIKALLYLFFHYKSLPMKVICDGEEVFEGQCFSVAVGTGRYCGGGLRQTPAAVVNDGLNDLTVIPQYSIPRILIELPRLFNGNFLKIKGLVIKRAKTVSIIPTSSRNELVEVDGEVIGSCPASFEVLPDKINVLHKP